MLTVGLVPLRDGNLEDVPVSLEVGLLAELRKQIILLPDMQVKRAFGKILNPECLLTMLNNKSALIRTAVIRVSVYSSLCVHACMQTRPLLLTLSVTNIRYWMSTSTGPQSQPRWNLLQ